VAASVRRALPSKPAERPKLLRGRAPGRRPGRTEARRTRIRRAAAVAGVTIGAPVGPRHAGVLTSAALAFLAALHRRFDQRRRELLAEREMRGAAEPSHGPTTPTPALKGEIVDPADGNAIVMALNSGAETVVTDFTAARAPSWAHILDGQVNLREYWAGTLSVTDPDTGMDRLVSPSAALPIMRPRPWHTSEKHLEVDRRPISAALFDFGLYAFHNLAAAIARGARFCVDLSTPATAAEAQLCDDVFAFTEASLGLPSGRIEAVVPAASARPGSADIG
jgi:malate synthase